LAVIPSAARDLLFHRRDTIHRALFDFPGRNTPCGGFMALSIASEGTDVAKY
jgi:hypothetical protein